jgi:hypothetical protein
MLSGESINDMVEQSIKSLMDFGRNAKPQDDIALFGLELKKNRNEALIFGLMGSLPWIKSSGVAHLLYPVIIVFEAEFFRYFLDLFPILF